MNPEVNGVCNVACLDLGEYDFPQMTVANYSQRIEINPIIYKNFFPSRKQALLSKIQVKYVEEIIVTRDTEHLGISRREVIQTISDMG